MCSQEALIKKIEECVANARMLLVHSRSSGNRVEQISYLVCGMRYSYLNPYLRAAAAATLPLVFAFDVATSSLLPHLSIFSIPGFCVCTNSASTAVTLTGSAAMFCKADDRLTFGVSNHTCFLLGISTLVWYL